MNPTAFQVWVSGIAWRFRVDANKLQEHAVWRTAVKAIILIP